MHRQQGVIIIPTQRDADRHRDLRETACQGLLICAARQASALILTEASLKEPNGLWNCSTCRKLLELLAVNVALRHLSWCAQ